MAAISQGNGNTLLIPITPVSRLLLNEMHPYPLQTDITIFPWKISPWLLLTLAYIGALSTRRNADLCLPLLSFRPSLTFVNPSVELNRWPCYGRGKSVKLNEFVARRHATRRHRLTIAKFINHARVHFATRRQTLVYTCLERLINNVRCVDLASQIASRITFIISRKGERSLSDLHRVERAGCLLFAFLARPFISASYSFLGNILGTMLFNGIIIFEMIWRLIVGEIVDFLRTLLLCVVRDFDNNLIKSVKGMDSNIIVIITC